MRKFITTAIAASVALPVVAIPVAASAQTAGEVRESRRDLREEQRELRDAERRGDRRDIREERRDVREARQELRQDWRDYRRSNRNVFNRPSYSGPRGYRYGRIGVGHRFDRPYLADRYWVQNWGRYRLPEPPRRHRWIRYGDDVILVNMRTGRAVTIYTDFFW